MEHLIAAAYELARTANSRNHSNRRTSLTTSEPQIKNGNKRLT